MKGRRLKPRLEGLALLGREVRLRALEAARRAALPPPNLRRQVSRPQALQARIYPPAAGSHRNLPL
jgi:hypothetical protein